MGTRSESPLAAPFIVLVGGLGCAALAGSVAELPRDVDVTVLLLLMAVSAIAQRRPIFLFRSSSISVSFAATVATYVLYGPGLALWVNLVPAVVNSFTPRPKPMRKIFFNVGSFTLAAFVASRTYAVLVPIPPEDPVRTLAAVVVSSMLYFAAGSSLSAAIIAFTTNVRILRVWRENYSWMPLHYLMAGVGGGAIALAYQALGLVGALVLVTPLVGAWYGLRLFMLHAADVHARTADVAEGNRLLRAAHERLERAKVAGIAALVEDVSSVTAPALDTIAATYPIVAIARDLGLSDEEVMAVHVAYLVHDIGNIALRQELLTKRDPLTSDEWTDIRMHPLVSAELLLSLPSMLRVRPIVLAHHEHVDGTGYPRGLKGTRIPVGARLIAIADAYEAMVSPRPYRAARSSEHAIRELRAAAGTQLDAALVERFIEKLGIQPSGGRGVAVALGSAFATK